ncbi:MAG: HupE/UreJ family protein [Sphingobacteriaceae bacterium]|nr:MAG: HupE/UreJ family protein [Sphingobacteriaceae bacterium]
MKRTLTIFFLLLLISPATFAHRLNEYLQATTISLSRDKVLMELRLTPGTDVAVQLLKSIDQNGDNQISAAEQQAYVLTVNHDLSLILDGRQVTLQPVSFTFPTAADVKKGVGDIIIEYGTNIRQKGILQHQLQLKNNHYSPIAVYLVNCLLPADATVQVISQNRNTSQSTYQLNFTTGNTPFNNGSIRQQSLEKANHWAAVKTYFAHGVRHILTGYDHLLFICALVLGAVRFWDLFKVVTAFTIAHSVTLTLAVFGYAHLFEYIVEPLIAISIVFVAVQNIAWPKQANGNSRLVVAFFFGLFHGLGFAGGLMELMHTMPTSMFIYAILGFSLGVEAGTQLVLLPLYSALQWLKRTQDKVEKTAQLLTFNRYASGAVAITGIYYLCIDLKACFR